MRLLRGVGRKGENGKGDRRGKRMEVTPDESATWIEIVVYMGVHNSSQHGTTGSMMVSTQSTQSVTTWVKHSSKK